MKISAQTLSLFKNFASVNPSILVKSGSSLKTISPQNNIMAEAQVTETFDSPFAIYDLNQFLGAVSLFGDPEFDFDADWVDIKEGARSVRFAFAAASMVKGASDKKIVLPSVDVAFSLTAAQLGEVLKAASVLGVPEVSVVSDGVGPTRLVASETKNKSSNSYNVVVDHVSPKSFKIIFRAEYFKMLSADYDVEVCSKGISKFTSPKLGLEYFLTSETTSEFGK